MKLMQSCCALLSLVAFVAAQTRPRSTKLQKSSNRNEPVAQGRTFGAIGSLFDLGSRLVFGPRLGGGSGLHTYVGYDPPSVPYRPHSTQEDPYYGANEAYSRYGGYGGYGDNGGYGGYVGYGGYRPNSYYGGFHFRPNYGYNGYNQPYGGPANSPYGYRPPVYGGYPGGSPGGNYQGFSRPQPEASSSVDSGLETPGSPGSNINPTQAAQVANWLGQILGSQLRPYVSGAGGGGGGDVGRRGRVRGVSPRSSAG